MKRCSWGSQTSFQGVTFGHWLWQMQTHSLHCHNYIRPQWGNSVPVLVEYKMVFQIHLMLWYHLWGVHWPKGRFVCQILVILVCKALLFSITTWCQWQCEICQEIWPLDVSSCNNNITYYSWQIWALSNDEICNCDAGGALGGPSGEVGWGCQVTSAHDCTMHNWLVYPGGGICHNYVHLPSLA